jgi:RIO kinase 1
VYDPERDVSLVQGGKGGDLIYARTGGVGIVGVDREARKIVEEDDGDEGSDGGSESGSDDEDGEDGEFVEKGPRGKRHEDPDAKKVCRSLSLSLILNDLNL